MDVNECLRGMNKDMNDIYVPVTHAETEKSVFTNQTENRLFYLEDNSWWFSYRASIIADFAKRFFPDKFVFDVGGGNGYTTKRLQQEQLQVALVEPSYQACLNGKKRGLDVVICAAMNDAMFEDGKMDACMLLDVLEHIEDDVAFLRIVNNKLSGDGYLLLTVPACDSLWSSEDDNAGHFRRYTLRQLQDTAQSAGLKVRYINYFFSFLFLPIFMVRVWGEKLHLLKPAGARSEEEQLAIAQQQFKKRGGLINFGLTLLEKAEASRLRNGKKNHFGSSLICILQKT